MLYGTYTPLTADHDDISSLLADVLDIDPVSQHSFYAELWNCGYLDRLTLQEYIRNASFYEMCVISGLQMIPHKNHEQLAKIANQHLEQESGHLELYAQHAAQFGVDDPLLFQRHHPAPAARRALALIDSFRSDGHPWRIVGALYVLEGTISSTAQKKAGTLWDFYKNFSQGRKDLVTSYYETHAEIDLHHADAWWRAILDNHFLHAPIFVAAHGMKKCLLDFLDEMERCFYKNVTSPAKSPYLHAVGM